MVAQGYYASYVYLRLLLRSRGHPLLGKLGWTDRRDCIAGDFGLSMFHVAQDEEAKEVHSKLVDQLGTWGCGYVFKRAFDCVWYLCRN